MKAQENFRSIKLIDAYYEFCTAAIKQLSSLLIHLRIIFLDRLISCQKKKSEEIVKNVSLIS